MYYNMATLDDLPPELVAKMLEMRFEGMVEDNRQRYVQRVVTSFWAAVWRAKPRVFRRRLYILIYIPQSKLYVRAICEHVQY
jgi:hypothetical protein